MEACRSVNASERKVTVLLADDHEIVLAGFQKILTAEFAIVGAVCDGSQLLELTGQLRPDVVITDLTMPKLNGIAAAKQIAQVSPKTKVVVLSMHREPLLVSQALDAGVCAFVLKSSPPSEIIKAVREALAGRAYLSPSIDRHTVDSLRRASKRSRGALSARQRQALLLLADGHSTKEIAVTMNISPRTVEFHKNTLLRKLGARNVADLIKIAAQSGLLTPAS